MPEEYTNRELHILIKDGFEAVCTRLDISNGRIAKNEKRLCNIETIKNKMIGALVFANIIFLPTIFILIKKYL